MPAVMRVVASAVSRSTEKLKRPGQRHHHDRAERAHRGGLGGRGDAADDGAEHRQHEADRRQADAQRGLEQLLAGHGLTLVQRDRRHHVRTHHAEHQQVDAEDRRQHEAGDQRGREQRADRLAEDVGQQDQDGAGRDDLAERARRADRAARGRQVIAAPHQGRQRDEAERDDGGADDAGGGAHQHADQDDADAHAAAQTAGQMADDVHQVVGDLGFLQHHAHEHEQRDGDQRVVGGHAVDARRQQIEQAGAEAEIAPEQPADGEREGHRHTDRQQHEERDDAQDRVAARCRGMSDRVRGAFDLRARIEDRDERAQHGGDALDQQQARSRAGSIAFTIQRCVSPPGSGDFSPML